MDKVKQNKASNPMSPHSPKVRAGGSVVTNQATGKGGFTSNPDTSVLGTINGIMKDQYNK